MSNISYTDLILTYTDQHKRNKGVEDGWMNQQNLPSYNITQTKFVLSFDTTFILWASFFEIIHLKGHSCELFNLESENESMKQTCR